MFVLFSRKIPTKTCRYFFQCKPNLYRNESTTSSTPQMTQKPHEKDIQAKLGDTENDNIVGEFLSATDGFLPQFRNQILDHERMFQNSSFQTLRMSDHGSLIQKSHKTTNSQRKSTDETSGGYFVDEEELNLDFTEFETTDTRKVKQRPINSIRSAMKHNPNESLYIKLIGKCNDYKIMPSSLDELYQDIIAEEGAYKAYDFDVPLLPDELTLSKFKAYLHRISSIDFTYDSRGFEKTVFDSLYPLAKNIEKFDGIADIDIMHQFVRYFCNYGMIRTVFRVIDKFEKMGIMPNRNTLHLLIYKLNKISNQNSRQDLLKLYLTIGMKKWKISTDLTTKTLFYFIEKPSKKRLALAKSLINEGVDHLPLRQEMCRDYVAIELNNRPKTNFKRMMKHLKKIMNLNNNDEEAYKIFHIYIDTLVQRNKAAIALEEISAFPRYERAANWETVITKHLKDNEIWNCIAIINIVKHKKQIDLRRVVFPLLQQYKQVYDFFTTQKFENYNEKFLFCHVMNILQDMCHTEVMPVAGFVEGILSNDDTASEFSPEVFRKQFCQIQLWDGKSRDLSRFFPIVGESMGLDAITRLWDVYVIEGERESLGMSSVDPVCFPWRPVK